MQFVQVCINTNVKSLDKLFTYKLPAALEHIEVGHRVIVPFGNMLKEGVVLEKVLQLDGAIELEKLKEVLDIVDEQPWFSREMLNTARNIADYYLCSYPEALKLFLVGNTGIKAEKLYVLAQGEKISALTAIQQTICQCLQGKVKKTYQELKKMLPEIIDLHKQLNKLLKLEVLILEDSVYKKFQEKQVWYIKISDKTKWGLVSKQAKRQLQVLALLEQQEEYSTEELQAQGISKNVLNSLVKLGAIEYFAKRIYRDSYASGATTGEFLQLNSQQQQVVDYFANLQLQTNPERTILLHGITGSGKTEVYLQLTKMSLARGRQTLILVPEIALTGQIVKRFQSLFKNQVVVSHSRLTQNERNDVYGKLRNGQAAILIAARSGVFAPFSELGLIVIDEEHENAYKQDNYPSYHAVQVAKMRAAKLHIPLVLGSATPSLTSYQAAQSGEYKYFELNLRAKQDAVLPEISLVDMRAELQAKNYSVISRALKQALEETISAGKQAIILLNRRGFSTFVMCRDCGYVVKCSNCDVSLVYHKQYGGGLTCHYCGHSETAPDICPQCRSHKIKFFGTGTQKLEEQLQKEFATVRILRMDQDSTKGKFGHDKILQAFAQGQAQILIGTQMVAKGHDFPNVTLVGILAADSTLNLPDYRAGEATFALLMQMAGRAGRGAAAGKVLIQTYNPENPIMQLICQQDYANFAAVELQQRQEFSYPPYVELIKFKITAVEQEKAEKIADELFLELQKVVNGNRIEIIGPFYGLVSKIKNYYSLHILIKGSDLTLIKAYCLREKIYLRKEIMVDVQPVNII